MPSKSHSEFEYRFLSRGVTIWEKVRELNRYLVSRERALKQQAVDAKRSAAKRAKLEYLLSESTPKNKHEILELEADILLEESFADEAAELYSLTVDEIALLNNLLEEARAIAEQTRIPGYSDEAMYDANAANEFTANIARSLQAEICATGHPNPLTLQNAMSTPYSFCAMQKLGYIPENARMLFPSDDPIKIEFKTGVPK